MKYFTFLSAIVLMSFMGGDKAIEWIPMEDAQTAAKADNKFILVDFTTSWCGPCRMLSKNTLSDKKVAAFVTEHMTAVKFNAEGPDDVMLSDVIYSNPNYNASVGDKGRNAQHQLAAHFGVRAYPTVLVLNAQGEKVSAIVGYFEAPEFLAHLKKITGKE